MTEPRCDYCGASDPVGGLTASSYPGAPRPGPFDLCQLCRMSLPPNGIFFPNGSYSEHAAIFQLILLVGNEVRKDVQRTWRWFEERAMTREEWRKRGL